MAGIEIIGFALAAPPLAVCLLQQYRQALQPFKIWASYERDIEALCDVIECEKAKFQNTSEHLLISTFPQDQVSNLMELPDATRWASPSMKRDICSVLGRSKEPFCKAAQRFHEALEELSKDLRASDSKEVRDSNHASSHPNEHLSKPSLVYMTNLGGNKKFNGLNMLFREASGSSSRRRSEVRTRPCAISRQIPSA